MHTTNLRSRANGEGKVMRKSGPVQCVRRVTYVLALGVLAAAAVGQSVPVDGTAVAGRKYLYKPTSLDDLLSGREDVLAPLRERAKSGVLAVTHKPVLRAGGTMDIGEIAVLEDDGTMVDPGTLVTDIIAIANAFLATHPDEYDELLTFVASNFPGDVEPEAGFAFYLGLAGFTAGINNGGGNPNESGGITRLNGLVNMNDLNEYPADFTTDFFGGGVASGVEILGQEFEHAYGAFVQSDTGDILGRGNAHWSFFLHHVGVGNASPMEGNRWVDNGDGTFTTVESFTGFGELDEYLMGLRAPANVSPFFLITPPAFDDGTFPSPGTTVSGARVDMTVQNIINLNGARLPNTTSSMKSFKVAFILVIPQGTTALPGDITKLDGFRLAWANYFATATEGLGTMDTTLAAGPVTSLPFSDDFNQSAPNPADWLFNQGCTISSLGIAEPSGGLSLRINGGWGGGDELRSRVIDLSGFAPGDITINYSVQRTGGGDSPEINDDLLVEYFNNTGTWVVLRTFLGSGPDQTTFTAFSDVLPADGLHSAFRLRFHRLQGQTLQFDEYFVDDVSIGVPPVPGDCDGDGVLTPADYDVSFAACHQGPGGGLGTGCDCNDRDTDGDVDLADFAVIQTTNTP